MTMKQYISKDALVAEIEKIKDEAEIYPSDFGCGRLSICKELMNFLDTLEVEEVDLEKELDFVKDAYYYFTSDEKDSMMKVARHFYELGIQKTQKGIEYE